MGIIVVAITGFILGLLGNPGRKALTLALLATLVGMVLTV